MKRICAVFVTLLLFVVAGNSQSTSSGNTDVYHVHFAKAALGQAKAFEADSMKQDPKAPMPGHFIVLKHQDGDDWDYVVIEHLGKKFTVDPASYTPPPSNAPATGAWHTDTFAAGPSWEVFAKEMGLAEGSPAKSGPYVVATWRAAPGHAAQLRKALDSTPAPNSKVKSSSVLLRHMEGGPWQFLTIDRYNSWPDFATVEAESQDSDGWYAVREHGVWHHDTIATRVMPAAK